MWRRITNLSTDAYQICPQTQHFLSPLICLSNSSPHVWSSNQLLLFVLTTQSAVRSEPHSLFTKSRTFVNPRSNWSILLLCLYAAVISGPASIWSFPVNRKLLYHTRPLLTISVSRRLLYHTIRLLTFAVPIVTSYSRNRCPGTFIDSLTPAAQFTVTVTCHAPLHQLPSLVSPWNW